MSVMPYAKVLDHICSLRLESAARETLYQTFLIAKLTAIKAKLAMTHEHKRTGRSTQASREAP